MVDIVFSMNKEKMLNFLFRFKISAPMYAFLTFHLIKLKLPKNRFNPAPAEDHRVISILLNNHREFV